MGKDDPSASKRRRMTPILGGACVILLVAVPVVHADTPSPPSAPWALVALPGVHGSVLLSWRPPLDDGGSSVTEYRVYRASLPDEVPCVDMGPGPSFPSIDSACFVGASETTTFTDSGDSGAAYVYSVRAVNVAGEGPGASVIVTRSDCIVIISEPPFVSLDPSCFVKVRVGIL